MANKQKFEDYEPLCSEENGIKEPVMVNNLILTLK